MNLIIAFYVAAYSRVFGIHKSVARCYMALASLGLKAAFGVCEACRAGAHVQSKVNNKGLLPHVIGSEPLIDGWLALVEVPSFSLSTPLINQIFVYNSRTDAAPQFLQKLILFPSFGPSRKGLRAVATFGVYGVMNLGIPW